MDRIHLGQVPRNSRGQIVYQRIPAVVVKILVAEEELHQLNQRIERHFNPADAFCFEYVETRIGRRQMLEKRLREWRELLDQ